MLAAGRWVLWLSLAGALGCAATNRDLEWEQQSCGFTEPEPELEAPEVADLTSCELKMLHAPQAVQARDDASLERAREHMKAARAFLDDPEGARYLEATIEIQRAYELTGSHKALLYFARAAAGAERNGEALDALERLLADDGVEEEVRAESEERHAELHTRTVWIDLRGDANGWTVRDVRLPTRGERVQNEYKADGCGLRLGVEPGSHTFTFIAPSGRSIEWRVELVEGASASHEAHFSQPLARGR
jgi:hypothetical protein